MERAKKLYEEAVEWLSDDALPDVEMCIDLGGMEWIRIHSAELEEDEMLRLSWTPSRKLIEPAHTSEMVCDLAALKAIRRKPNLAMRIAKMYGESGPLAEVEPVD